LSREDREGIAKNAKNLFLEPLRELCEPLAYFARNPREKTAGLAALFPVTENEVARQIVDAALHVHRALGPGLLETVYEAALAYELEQRGLRATHQQPIPMAYGPVKFRMGFRADLLVEDEVIVEVKSIDAVAAVHRKQLLTYLRLSGKRLGLLINFNVALLKDGIARLVNGLPQ
jgi:GxxExxY protein